MNAMQTKSSCTRGHRLILLVPALMALGLVMALVWVGGCSPNEPFDPDSIINHAPVMNMSVSPVDETELNPTSYYSRRFSWFGSDQDGWVDEYYVSIRTDATVAAPWDTTTRTDTTMTFVTDNEGSAEAMFFLVCRDNRGALSDTLKRFIPLRNFPPAVNFQSDFDPVRNMQREVTMDGTTPVDTTYWNWGVSNFRFFALDLDGVETMDDYFRYTMSPDDPTETYDLGDPLADPLTTWVRAPFSGEDEVKEFEILISGAPAGLATLTVSVTDEAAADTRMSYSWEVREPKSNILYIKDNTSTAGRALYTSLMDQRFGEGNWDLYDFWFGFPDNGVVLLETMRLYEAVIWTDGGTTSDNLRIASARGGILESYMHPEAGEVQGRLLMVSKVLTGSLSGLPASFIQGVVGVSPTGDPAPTLNLVASKQILGLSPHLTPATCLTSTAKGIGMKPLAGTEPLYRLEECAGCYGRRPPWDPIVAVRRPELTVEPFAEFVGFSLQLEYFDSDQVIAALTAVLDIEMGVPAP